MNEPELVCHVPWCDIPEPHEHHERECCERSKGKRTGPFSGLLTVVVHDPDPHPTHPITPEEIEGGLEAMGYRVSGVLIRHDVPPPCFLVDLHNERHYGPFSTRMDAGNAAYALDDQDMPDPDRELTIMSEDEFRDWIEARHQRRQQRS